MRGLRFVWARAVRDTRGQATVEAAVCLPAAIVVGLVAFNLLRFASLCARFDRVALDTVISQGVSPLGEAASTSAAGAVRAALAEGMGLDAGAAGDVAVAVSEAIGTPSTLSSFTCTLSMRPWPGSLSIAGVRMDAPALLVHERVLSVDRYRPGIVLRRE